MKKCILFSILACLSLPTRAQTEKGNFLVGGTITASSSSSTLGSLTGSSTNFGVSPSVSYFFAPNFAAGIITNYAYSSATSESGGVTSKTNILSDGIGPTVRYYFPLGGKFWLFPEVDYLWSGGHTQFSTNGTVNSDLKTSSQSLRVGPGVTYFVAKSVGVEALVYYSNVNTDQTTTTVSQSNSSSGINFRIGLQVYISKGNE